MKKVVMSTVATGSAFLLWFGASVVFAQAHPTLAITVMDLTAGQTVKPNHGIAAGHQFQVTVTGNGVNCAGQYVVSALGTSSPPPPVLVQVVPFVVGPAGAGNSVTGEVLTAGTLPNGTNEWKISASCNGARGHQFAFDRFEFSAP